jgi:hypothetical protein
MLVGWARRDDRRLTTLKRHLVHNRLSSSEAKAAIATFHANTYKAAASRVIKQSAGAKRRNATVRPIVASR